MPGNPVGHAHRGAGRQCLSESHCRRLQLSTPGIGVLCQVAEGLRPWASRTGRSVRVHGAESVRGAASPAGCGCNARVASRDIDQGKNKHTQIISCRAVGGRVGSHSTSPRSLIVGGQQ